MHGPSLVKLAFCLAPFLGSIQALEQRDAALAPQITQAPSLEKRAGGGGGAVAPGHRAGGEGGAAGRHEALQPLVPLPPKKHPKKKGKHHKKPKKEETSYSETSTISYLWHETNGGQDAQEPWELPTLGVGADKSNIDSKSIDVDKGNDQPATGVFKEKRDPAENPDARTTDQPEVPEEEGPAPAIKAVKREAGPTAAPVPIAKFENGKPQTTLATAVRKT